MTPSGDFVLCVACRLGIACEKLLEEGKGHTLVTRPTNQAGSPGVAHGGWTASLLDGMLGHLALFIGTFTVTSSLSVEYLCPVSVERELEGFAWIVRREDGRWDVAGELRLAGTKTRLVRATGCLSSATPPIFKNMRRG